MNEGKFIITSFALFLTILGTIAILFAIPSGIMQMILVLIFIIAGVSSLKKAHTSPSGWMLTTLTFAAININLLYLGLSAGFTKFLGLMVAAGIIGMLVAVTGVQPSKEAQLRQKLKERSRRDSIMGEVTIQPLKELKEGELLPGAKAAELYDFKTNEMYNSKAPVVNPKYAGKKTQKVQRTGKYVGSLTGKYYYPADSTQAKRIKASNKIWFKTDAEAKKKGYKKYS